jgi:hypothetical protein
MKKLDSYAELPFENLKVGRDRISDFFTDHGNRLTQAVADGAPFHLLVSPYKVALTNLTGSKTGTAINVIKQGVETRTVDNYIELFKEAITALERKVLVAFKDKESIEYYEFFPQGKSAFSYITKVNIDNRFSTIITACKNHKDRLGEDQETEFEALQAGYLAARERQQMKKESTDSTRSGWDEYLAVITDLAFHNLLVIADQYRGQPEKIGLFFDQSMITLHNHNHKEEEGIQE